MLSPAWLLCVRGPAGLAWACCGQREVRADAAVMDSSADLNTQGPPSVRERMGSLSALPSVLVQPLEKQSRGTDEKLARPVLVHSFQN